MKKLKNRFKNIKPQTLLTHVIVTLLYPLARVVMASSQRLLIFTDCLTIVAAILLALLLWLAWTLISRIRSGLLWLRGRLTLSQADG